MTRIRALTFDLGGTLWYSPPDSVLLDEEKMRHGQGKRMDTVFLRHGIRSVDGVTLNSQFWDEYERQISSNWSIEPDGLSILEDLLSAKGVRFNSTLIQELWSESYLGYKLLGIRLYQDAMPTLQWAKDQGLRLGLITQRPFGQDFLRRDLEGLHIADFFDVALASADVGLRKPRPELFLQVAVALNIDVAEIAMVGDMLETDVAGAESAGMVTVWLNRDGRSPEDWDHHYPRINVTPDYIIQSLDQLRDHEMFSSLPG